MEEPRPTEGRRADVSVSPCSLPCCSSGSADIFCCPASSHGFCVFGPSLQIKIASHGGGAQSSEVVQSDGSVHTRIVREVDCISWRREYRFQEEREVRQAWRLVMSRVFLISRRGCCDCAGQLQSRVIKRE